jgi:hypothetical protein
MKSISEIYENLSARDAEVLEKQAAEIKLAVEEDAAGRIMARGFADEARRYIKLAAWTPGSTVPETPNDLGAVRNYKVGPGGKATGTNTLGQKVQSTPTGGMAPPKMPVKTTPRPQPQPQP